jgi:opacity protein-like surface antigen
VELFVNKRKRVGVAAGLAYLGLAAAAPGFAAEPGFYLGLSGGQASYDASQDDFDAIVFDALTSSGFIVVNGSSDLDDSDTGFSGLGGYRFNPYLAVEAAYVDLGELSYTGTGTVRLPPIPGTLAQTVSLTAATKGPMISAVGSIPLSDAFDLYGRAGILFADTEVDISLNVSGVSSADSFSDDSQDTVLGLGGAWHVGDAWTFRLEYQRALDVGSEDTGETDVDFVSLGALFNL